MIAEGGGFAASLDADSEGEEGKFYVWSRDDVLACWARRTAPTSPRCTTSPRDGNFEGHNILNRLHWLALRSPDEERRLAALRAKLLAERDKRVRPGWDDKVLADWNGLMIAALARAVGRVRAARVAGARQARLRFRRNAHDARTAACCTPIATARRRRRRRRATTPT